MGFTFSHPALIVPFRYLPKRFYSLSGLVIGSIIPDFEYFIRFGTTSIYSHTIPGIFWFDLPMAFLMLYLFHQLVRNPLLHNLPAFLKLRLWPLEAFNWPEELKRKWILVTVSIFIGITTHLFWDSWTSGTGYFVEKYAFFMEPVPLGHSTVFVYQITKNISSVLGALLLIYQIFLLPKRTPPHTSRNKFYWPVYFAFLFIIITVQYFLGFHTHTFSGLIKKGMASGLLALLLVSLPIWKWNKAYAYQP
jgi:hypothetical protein